MRYVAVMVLCVLLFPLMSYGQEIKEDVIKKGKTECNGFIATSKYETSLVEEAMTQQLGNAGITKGKTKSKFHTYKDVTLAEISPNKIDIYYKVHKKKHKSVIYFIVSKGYDNYVTSGNDAAMAANINTFLGKIDATVAHNEEVRLKEEEVRQMNAKLEQQKKALENTQEEKDKKAKELNELKQEKK